MGRHAKPEPQRPPNPFRNRKEIVAPTIFTQRAAQKAAAASRPAKRACPNKQCATPQIEDGVCHNCGTIVDDSNIISEIQFGENSSGAAVVQGSFVGADQGMARSMGPAFKRAGGDEGREGTVRAGRQVMQGLANQLGIIESTVVSGVQIFKIAAMNNFIQGRRIDMVAAVCLYTACRKEKPCQVMLIDIADKLQVNVFKLGHTFKALHSTVTLAKDGVMPVLPEDLIYRFAMKLEFGILTNKVAEDAVRMVQRMSLDWMVMGRRPSGVCGACLILAARMNNFRRTITEVVYVVKVTTHTIQKRLDEFKLTPSSALTVEEFLNNEFLESAHDPPSFYEKSEEFQKKKKSRKRKRKNRDALEENEENSGEEEENGDDSNKRQKTATPNPDNAVIAAELRIDADGFAIPPQPTQPTQLTQPDDIPIDPNLMDNAIEDQCGTSFEKLVGLVDEQLDDAPLRAAAAEKPTSEQGGSDEDETSPTAAPKRRGPKPDKSIRVPSEWAQAEASMEGEISEIINDPNSIDHAMSYANAAKRAAAHMLLAEKTNPQRIVNMDVHVGEDEFADDPEVKNCLLAPAAVAAREVIWVNENKAWLRKQQLKEYQKRMAEQGPPKARRNRKKKPRIGEGQTSAASSPGEAAVNVLKQRAFSKKINYDAIRGMFEGHSSGAASALGSAGTSRVTSRAGSVLGSRASSVTPSVDASADGGSEAGDRESASVIIRPPKRRRTAAERDESDIESDDDDYVKPTPAPAPKSTPSVQEDEETNDWRGAIKSSHATGGEDEDDYDEEDYGYENGDIDDTGFGMDDEDTGFGDDD